MPLSANRREPHWNWLPPWEQGICLHKKLGWRIKDVRLFKCYIKLSCHALWGLRFLLGFFYLFYCQAHSNVFLILSACWLATDFYFLLIYCVLGKWITSLWEVCVCMCVCEQVLSGNLRDWVITLLCVVFVTSILTAQKPYSFQSQHLGKTAIWKGKMKFKIRSKKVNIVGVHCRPGFKCFSFCVLVSKLSHEDRLANSIYRWETGLERLAGSLVTN